MSVISNNQLAGAAGQGGADAGYTIQRSLRFNSEDSSNLSRTPSSAGNRRTFTFSFWTKLGKSGTAQTIISAYDGSSTNQFEIRLQADDTFFLNTGGNSGNRTIAATSAVYRDPSAWYHLVCAVDTTEASASNHFKFYINGILQTLSLTQSGPQNLTTHVNGTFLHQIGVASGPTRYFDGYLAEVHFIDGQALAPTDFGEYDDDNNWNPKDASGLTFGTNGFHLDFSSNSTNAALGTDSSGNNNDFTVNNLNATGATSVASVLNLPLNATPFADSSASSATVTNIGSISTTSAATNSFSISTVASLNGSSQRLTTNNNNISFQNNWTVDAYFIIDNGSTAYNILFNSGYGSQTSNYMYIGFDNNDKPYVETTSSGSRTTAANAINKNQWYHMRVIQKNGTITMYLNGTSVLTKTAQTTNLSSAGSNTIGSAFDNANNANNFFGQLGPFRIINDALDAPSSGGEATSSGTLLNSETKIVAEKVDSLIDTPTNYEATPNNGGNYATLNPLNKHNTADTFSEGNLKLTSSGSGSAHLGRSTIAMSSGKYYWEVTWDDTSQNFAGIQGQSDINYNNSYIYLSNAKASATNGSSEGSSYGASWGNGDVIGIAYDADNATLTFYKNGVSQGTAFTSITGTSSPYPSGYVAFFGNWSGQACTFNVNFGQRPFKHPVSGYKSLCTTNLPQPVIADGSTAFDVVTWSGTGSSQTISTGFDPDLIWSKTRNYAVDHKLVDSVRGFTKQLETNQTIAEYTNTTGVTGTSSTGFTIGTGNDWNNPLNRTYVGWAWDAGSSTVSNTDGSITSNVRANPSAGVSIVSFQGNGSTNQTVGHSLNAKPSLVIYKDRDSTSAWRVIATFINDGHYLALNSNQAGSTNTAYFGTNTSSVIGISGSNSGIINANGNNIIAYCFAPVEGYSAFGSYTANGSSTDGPFVYTGFAVAWLMTKRDNANGNWEIHDLRRPGYNPQDERLLADGSTTEVGGNNVDLLSNGFKVRNSFSGMNNTNGDTYLYAAFAEHPMSLNGGLAR
jgi:hypothetical protein